VIRFSAFIRYCGEDYSREHQLLIDFKKALESMRREELYNILIECGVPMNLVWLLTVCLNET
jgi:hypothetical protein